jgi:hypothetical protein
MKELYHPTGRVRAKTKRPPHSPLGKAAYDVFKLDPLRKMINSYGIPIICPMILKLKTMDDGALTLYDPPPPQPGADLLWNNGSAGISTGCIQDLSYDQINKYIISLVKLIRDAADIIDREGEVYFTFLKKRNKSDIHIRIFKSRTLWALVIGKEILIGGEIEGENIVKTFFGNRMEEDSIRPFFEKSWRSDGKGAAMGILEIMSIIPLIPKIKMDAIFGIKRY